MEKVWFKLPRFIMQSKGLVSRELEGRVVRYTDKGILAKVRPVIEASDVCKRCGKEITNPVSLMVGYGPECSTYLGIPRDFPLADLNAIKKAARREAQMELWLPRRYAFDEDGNYWTPAETVEDPIPTDAAITIEDKGGVYKVSFPYNRRIVDAVKQLRGRRYDPDTKSWLVAKDSARELFALYERFTGEKVPLAEREQMEREDAERATRIEDSKAKDANFVVPQLGGELMPFQRAGVKYAVEAERVLIGDEMGLGKTVQALATVQSLNAYPAVVVVPASVKINWQREAQKWLPGKSVRVINGGKGRLRSTTDVFIINYDVLEKWLDKFERIQPKAVVFDEMHYVKNSAAKRSKAAEKLAEGCQYVVGLTGTAILNRPDELIHPLTILRHLDSFGGYAQFKLRYGGKEARNLTELNEKLRSLCYVRREKKDVLTEMPDKRKAVVPIPLSNRARYNEALRDLIQYLKEEAAADIAFLESIAHLRPQEREDAIREHQRDVEVRARNAEHLVRINALKKLAARGKLSGIEDWIKDFLASGEKLVVFGHHKEMVQTLAKKFNAPYIDGSRTTAQRQEAVDMFQNDPDCKLIVLNMQAGGVGLTLTAASNVVFTELAWTPALHQQAGDRCHRIGQKNAVTLYYLLASDTIEEDIASLLDAKQVITDAVNIGEEAEDSMSILQELISNIVKGAGK